MSKSRAKAAAAAPTDPTAGGLLTPAIPEDQIRALEAVAEACSIANLEGESHIRRAFLMAAGIAKVKAMLTPAVMQAILPLMNTPLGFLTDRDPRKPGKNGTPVAYPEPVVRDCIAEALIRGFYFVNNEMNIIAGRFYGAKNGYIRKCREYPGFSDDRIELGVPQGGRVKARATWLVNGKPDAVEREFTIRVNEGQGADAVWGKATRKIYAAVWEILSGQIADDADTDDGDAITVQATAPAGPSKLDEFAARFGDQPKPAAPVPAQPMAPAPAEAPAATPAAEADDDGGSDEAQDDDAAEGFGDPATYAADQAAEAIDDADEAERRADALYGDICAAIQHCVDAGDRPGLMNVGLKIAEAKADLNDAAIEELRGIFRKAQGSLLEKAALAAGAPAAAAPQAPPAEVKRGRGRPRKDAAASAPAAADDPATAGQASTGNFKLPDWTGDATKWVQKFTLETTYCAAPSQVVALLDRAKQILGEAGAPPDVLDRCSEAAQGRLRRLNSR